jgi:ribulose 1,5-bisphosphate carboxylase large subunit-like protein
MRKPLIVSITNVSEDHIIVKLRVGFLLDNSESFSDGVIKLIDTISYGGKGDFESERSGAKYEYQIKTIGFENDGNAKGNEVTGRIQIAIPVKLCPPSIGIPQILSAIMYASVYSFITEFQVTDINLPDIYLKHFPEPKYGTTIFSGSENDLRLGMILKPRSILNAEIANELIGRAVDAGIDYITDDELTIDPPEWRFKDRVQFITSLLRDLKSETKKEVKYIANISGSFDTSMKLAKIADELGADGVMVNTITMGYDVVQSLAKNKKFKKFIVANVIGRNLMAGGTKYLVADHIHSLLARVSGADAVYTGPFIGNVNSRHEKAAHFNWALTDSLSRKYPVKKVYAVMSGGLEPNNLLENYRIYSSPVMFSIGLSLCNLIEQKISIEKVLEIIRTVFEAEKRGGAEQVEKDITQLAAKHPDYFQILKKLKWT